MEHVEYCRDQSIFFSNLDPLILQFILSEVTITEVAKRFMNCGWSVSHEESYGSAVSGPTARFTGPMALRWRGTPETDEVDQVLFDGGPPPLVIKQPLVIERRTAEAEASCAAALGALDRFPIKKRTDALDRVVGSA